MNDGSMPRVVCGDSFQIVQEVKPDMAKVRQPYRNMDDKRVKALYERTGGGKALRLDRVQSSQERQQ